MATYLINGQSPASLGVELCRRVRRNQAIDTVTLQLTTEEGITGVLPFAYDEEVVITRDGVTWFRGWVMSPIVAGQPGAEGMSIEIGGPWWQLQRVTYTRPVELEAEEETTGRYFYGMSGSVRQTTLEMITDVLEYAISCGVALQVGTLALDEVKPPRATKVDRHCDELVTSAMEWHPDVVAWFDYTTSPPTFNLTKRGDEGTVAVVAVDDEILENCSPLPRPDLVTSGVVIRYERGGVQLTLDGTRPAQLVDDYPDGADPTAFDAVVQTVTTAKNEVALPGLAQRIYEAFSTLIWEGGVTLVEEDCDTGLRPGMSLNVTGGQTAWETMQALIQGVSEDLMTGTTSVEFGLPQFCGHRPRLLSLTRRRHNDRDKDANAAGDERLEAVEPTEPPSTALTLYAAEVNAGAGSCQIRVTPGFVTASYGAGTGDEEDESEDEVYPTLDGTDLAAVPPPYIALAAGGSVTVWLELHVTPTMQQFDFTDSMGEVVTEYRPTLPLIIGTCRIVSPSAPTGRRWEVDYMTGEVTDDARLFLRLGSATWASGADAPVVSPQNEANVGLVYMPPQGLIRIPV